MKDIKALALEFGGYTSLDAVYLDRVLASLSPEQALTFITPPPSVVNAYFAELYQKKSPQAAMTYLENLSRGLDLWQEQPDFTEVKPFVRLNLSGKAFGLALAKEGRAIVFGQEEVEINPDLLFEIAEIFPDHWVFVEKEQIILEEVASLQVLSKEEVSALTDLETLSEGWKRLVGYSQEDLLAQHQDFTGQERYRSNNRQVMMYVKEK